MGLWIRERPSPRLNMFVQTPGGPAYRWGADDYSNVRNIPNALSFTTAMPGGFNDATCTLERDPRASWPDLQEFSTITIYGLGGTTVAWQGRLEEFPSTGGSQANFQPQMVGWQSHLSDDDEAAMIYVDQNLGSWIGPSINRQLQLLTGNYAGDNPGSIASNPSGAAAIATELSDSWTSTVGNVSESWYDSGAAGPIGSLFYSWQIGPTMNPADSNWVWAAVLSSDDIDSSVDTTGSLRGPGPASGTLTATTTRRWAQLQMYYTTSGGVDGATYPIYWGPVAVYGNHGLTGTGSPPGFLASQIIAHALTQWAPVLYFTEGVGGTIQDSSFVIDQAVFQPTTVASIIQQVAGYELLDWAVWEPTPSTPGPTFYLNARGARGRQWVSRVGDCQLQAAGPQASNIYNGVIVTWTNVDGTTGTYGPPTSTAINTSSSLLDSDPQNPANEAGIRKWGLLALGTSTAGAALQAGEAFLAVQAQINTSGQASLVGHAQDALTGQWWPAWMVRAGDTLIIQDAADTTARRIVSTSYDDTSLTNTLQLDQPPATMTALLAQMSEAISPLGLS